MAQFQVRTATEQLAVYLRGELTQRRWTGELPGGNRLAKELGVGKSTMEAALAQLEAEGILVPQGARRQRRIHLENRKGNSSLRIQILLYEDSDRKLDFLIEIIYKLQQAGHVADFTGRTLVSMGMDAQKVANYATEMSADAWIVVGGNREILEWFAGQPQPAYALFGRSPSVNIGGAGTSRAPALIQAVENLIGRGHERIAMLSRTERRKPEPGLSERSFLETLEKHGITAGSCHLPDWEDDPAGLRNCLDSLFALTPPTALIIDQPHSFLAAMQHLSMRGLVAPRDLSMLCNDYGSVFEWTEPAISHIRWDSKRLIQHTLQWVRQIARGKDSRRQSLVGAEFVQGGTIGPPPLPSR